mmetsp:Transcript_43098/g.57023  ORF Transcript_43098/g.57023 Transcript_43098/m.57023 type:complete len:134 (-) Transcript_43098:747-1148(-)
MEGISEQVESLLEQKTILEALFLLWQAEPKKAHKTLSGVLKNKDATYHCYLAKVFVEIAVAEVLASEAAASQAAEVGSEQLFLARGGLHENCITGVQSTEMLFGELDSGNASTVFQKSATSSAAREKNALGAA